MESRSRHIFWKSYLTGLRAYTSQGRAEWVGLHDPNTYFVHGHHSQGSRWKHLRLKPPPGPPTLGDLYGQHRAIFSTSLTKKLQPLGMLETISGISALPHHIWDSERVPPFRWQAWQSGILATALSWGAGDSCLVHVGLKCTCLTGQMKPPLLFWPCVPGADASGITIATIPGRREAGAIFTFLRKGRRNSFQLEPSAELGLSQPGGGAHCG